MNRLSCHACLRVLEIGWALDSLRASSSRWPAPSLALPLRDSLSFRRLLVARAFWAAVSRALPPPR